MGEVKYKICSKCGAQMQIEEGVVCTSIPPMFRYKCPVCGNVEFDLDKYPMPVADLDKNYGSVAPPFFFDWQAFRAEAAKDILCAFITTPNSVFDKDSLTLTEVAEHAIDLTDWLIAKLKQDGKD